MKMASQQREDNPVRRIRQALEKTQEQLSRELGCSIATVRWLEQNSKLPRNEAVLDNLRQMAEKASITVDF